MELGLLKKKENIGCPGLEEAPLLEKKKYNYSKAQNIPFSNWESLPEEPFSVSLIVSMLTAWVFNWEIRASKFKYGWKENPQPIHTPLHLKRRMLGRALLLFYLGFIIPKWDGENRPVR
jgi:hypothetical protein